MICSEHFEPSQFVNPTARHRLYKTAVPTLFDVPNPPKPVTVQRLPPKKREIISTPSPSLPVLVEPPSPSTASTSTSTFSPTKKILQNKVSALTKKISRRDKKVKKLKERIQSNENLDDVRQVLSQRLSGLSLDFIMAQLVTTQRPKHGRRWASDMKRLSLTLLHASPKAFHLLRKLFCLPSVSTLKGTMSNLDIDTGFNLHLTEAFRTKVTAMKMQERLCVLLFDEMSIKENLSYNAKKDRIDGFEDFGQHRRGRYVANQASVFMVRSITGQWKQPIAYYFSSGPVCGRVLKELILEAVAEVQKIGLTVKVFVCDQGSNNRSAIGMLGVTQLKPYFSFHDEKVFVIYDPPHLLKNIRNNFKKHGFVIEGKSVKWDHISQFYYADCKLKSRFAPKLKERHINLPPFSAMRVRLAAQVLSHSVYAGMTTMIEFGRLPEECQITADFVKHFDSLFNCFNCRKPKSTIPFQHAMTINSNHKEFLMEMLDWLPKVQPKSSRLPCLEGWQLSIRSLLGLFEELHEKHEVKYLLTGRLNQDCLENLFSVIRGKGGHRDNPSTQEFRSAFLQVLVDRLFLTSSSKNCQDDLDQFLFHLQASSQVTPLQTIESSTKVSLINCDVEEGQFSSLSDVQEANTVTYIAGYIGMKVSDKLCSECSKVIQGTQCDQKHQMLLKHKLYTENCKHGLFIPSDHVVNICLILEKSFDNLFEGVCYSSSVMKTLSSRLYGHVEHLNTFVDICEKNCETVQRIVKLYANIRLRHSLKLSNQDMRSTKSQRKNRKLMKLSHQ